MHDWLLVQFSKGKEPEDILKQLNIPEEEKAEKIRLASTTNIEADPESDEPPVLAYGLQIKYPDLYNRYRKVGPPLRAKKGGGAGEGTGGPRKGKKRKAGESGEVDQKEAVEGDEQPGQTGTVSVPEYLGDGVEDFTFADLDESLHHLEADLQAHADAQTLLNTTASTSAQAASQPPVPVPVSSGDNGTAESVAQTGNANSSTDDFIPDESGPLGGELDMESMEEEEFQQLAHTIVGTWTG